MLCRYVMQMRCVLNEVDTPSKLQLGWFLKTISIFPITIFFWQHGIYKQNLADVERGHFHLLGALSAVSPCNQLSVLLHILGYTDSTIKSG